MISGVLSQNTYRQILKMRCWQTRIVIAPKVRMGRLVCSVLLCVGETAVVMQRLWVAFVDAQAWQDLWGIYFRNLGARRFLVCPAEATEQVQLLESVPLHSLGFDGKGGPSLTSS